jgi:hypothetical protein
VILGAEGQRTVVSTYHDDLSLLLRSVAPESGAVRTEFRLQPETCCAYPDVAWTVAGDTIFIGMGPTWSSTI